MYGIQPDGLAVQHKKHRRCLFCKLRKDRRIGSPGNFRAHRRGCVQRHGNRQSKLCWNAGEMDGYRRRCLLHCSGQNRFSRAHLQFQRQLAVRHTQALAAVHLRKDAERRRSHGHRRRLFRLRRCAVGSFGQRKHRRRSELVAFAQRRSHHKRQRQNARFFIRRKRGAMG